METGSITSVTVSTATVEGSLKRSTNSEDKAFSEVMESTVKTHENQESAKTSETNGNNYEIAKKMTQKVSQGVTKKTEVEEEVVAEEMEIEEGLVVGLEEEILNLVAEQLDITPEAVTLLLDQLNLSAQDLLEHENLQTLIKANYGVSDLMEVLVNPNEASNVRDLFLELQNVAKTYEAIQADETSIEMANSDPQVEALELTVEGEEGASLSDSSIQNSETSKETADITITQTETSEEMAFKTGEETSSNNGQSSQQEGFEFNTLIQKVSEHFESNGVSDNMAFNGTEVDYEAMIKDLVEQFRVQIKPEVTKMEFQLKPDHLGKLSFSVMTKEGTVTAQMVAESQAVKETIESQLPMLKQTLTEQGLKVDKVEVILSNEAFNQQEQQEKQEETPTKKSFIKLGRFIPLEDEEVIEEEDVLLKETSSINYTV